MLQVSNLTKTYGSRILFEEATFSMISGERLGLVGRNGCGKSTLFRLVLGDDFPDDGEISVPRGYRIGHLAQHLNFTQPSILKEVCLGLREDERDQEYRGEIILSGLGFAESDYARAPSEFSGGFQIRLNLAKLLLSEPNLLLLDEPTNYLDIVSIRWLTNFLREWPGELIIISHDRDFMDSVTTHTMLIHRGSVKKVKGNTAKLYAQVAQDEEVYEKTRVNEDKKRRDLELFINRFRAQASKAALVQSKIKALERMGQRDELAEETTLDFQFCEASFPGKRMLEAKALTFGYDPAHPLIKDLSFQIENGQRIGIIGKNGKGKSTLLRLLAGELAPQSGALELSPNARLGYFGQSNIDRLSKNLTVEEEVSNANPTHSRTKVRAICGTMMFSGDDALKKISVLSGGERSRVLLGRILAQPTNFLLLDEPTNHLDMDSIAALIESLRSYKGGLAIVTHSELILRELADRLIVFQGDTPEVLEHGYDYFLEKVGWGDEQEASSSAAKDKQKNKGPQHQVPSNNKNPSKQLQKQVAQLEDRIAKLEAELEKVSNQLAEASQKGEVSELTGLSVRLKELEDAVSAGYVEWEALLRSA